MSKKLQAEIDRVVAEMSPPPNTIGMLTTKDVRDIIKQAATQGVMAGWTAGERAARAHWSREVESLNTRIKELEMERIAASR